MNNKVSTVKENPAKARVLEAAHMLMMAVRTCSLQDLTRDDDMSDPQRLDPGTARMIAGAYRQIARDIEIEAELDERRTGERYR